MEYKGLSGKEIALFTVCSFGMFPLVMLWCEFDDRRQMKKERKQK